MSSTLTPSAQLSLSRARLRLALHDTAATPAPAQSRYAGSSAVAWQDSLKAIPGAGVVLDVLVAWWAQHPWRMASLLAADAVKAVVQPIARRHPLGLVLGSFLVGGLIAWSRPWRFILTPALFAGLLPQLLSQAVVRQPPRSWIEVLAALAQPVASTPQPTQPSRP